MSFFYFMCTNPILIRNKKFRSISANMPNSFIKVPCGQCDECLRKRAKDLYLRARFEVEQGILNGGSAFMCCLTYGKKSPTLFYDGKTYLVFNKEHVKKFIKRLRTNLDRFYKKEFGSNAPDFKYLVTSEFGTDPTRSHLPHYHFIFSFMKSISLFIFRKMFIESMTNKKTGKSEFGFIFQCDLLDLSKGGIRYSSKYILKDQTYTNQNTIINKFIKFYTSYVNQKHNIIENPKNYDEVFKNKCIRSSKSYKDDISKYVSPYRNMLQFYLCSNDFGCSAICSRYGESLFSLGVLNIDGLPYSIPKQVVQRLERTQGNIKKDSIVKTIFISQLERALNDCENRNLISKSKAIDLLQFASAFIQPRFGSLYFVNPHSVGYWNLISNSPLQDYAHLYEEFEFYNDNNFFTLRNEIIEVINLCNSPLNLEFRAKLAYNKSKKEREDYEKRKRNKPANY